MRELFKKGLMDVLLLILKRDEARFSEVTKFCLENRVVRSRGTVSAIMRNLTDMNLLETKNRRLRKNLQRRNRNNTTTQQTPSPTKKPKLTGALQVSILTYAFFF